MTPKPPLRSWRGEMQSKFASLIESIANIAVGAIVALISQLAIFPLFDIHIPMSSNFGIMAWFTAISVVRSYVVRRYFNGLKFFSSRPTLNK